jgi:hypothetical protein
MPPTLGEEAKRVEPQRHREHREKTKQKEAEFFMVLLPIGQTSRKRLAGKGSGLPLTILLFCFSLCSLCLCG